MKFFAFAIVANSVLLATAYDSDLIKNEVDDILEEVKEEIEDNLPESKLFFYLSCRGNH